MVSLVRRLPLLVVVFSIPFIGSAQAAKYVVDGLVLGEKIAGPNFQPYACKRSDEFARLTLCGRTQARSGSSNFELTGTVMHKEDGTAVYLMIKVAPVTLTRRAVQKEIDDLSRELGRGPTKLEWQGQDQQQPISVIATWGQIKLEPIGFETSEVLEAGNNPRIGVLVDALADAQRATEANLTVYRISGGTGYVYSASFDGRGRGHRQYIAADGDELVVRQYETALSEVLREDESLPAYDLHLWSKVAEITRRLARDTSPAIANRTIDTVFEGFASKKLRTHVWAYLPGGAIQHLGLRQHWDVDIYGPKTKRPDIRRAIEQFLRTKPSGPFVELLHYVIGEYDEALRVNPESALKDVLHYASGFRKLGPVLHDAIAALKAQTKSQVEEPEEIFRKINLLIEDQSLTKGEPLDTVVPGFTVRVEVVRPHFEAVLRDPTSPHADDAAFMLGWLSLQARRTKEALSYFSKALIVGNDDYRHPGAVRRVLRVLDRLSAREQVATVDFDPAFSKEPAVSYVAARSAYREFNYALTIEAASRYLTAMGVQPDRLPETTDPKRISKALDDFNDIDEEIKGDANFTEIPYLLHASKELSAYTAFLQKGGAESLDVLIKKARDIIMKYSTKIDEEDDPPRSARKPGLPEFAHRDFRQALHLIDITLANTPKTVPYWQFREWLYYRKVRVSVEFAPTTIPDVIAAMTAEFPASKLLDDVLAEQLHAEGLVIRNLDAARKTFKKLVETYPTGNAIDNAYSWMGIILRCEKRFAEAKKLNVEIIRRFPLTRHAVYAGERLAKPESCDVQGFEDR